jgi:uncharacterized protein
MTAAAEVTELENRLADLNRDLAAQSGLLVAFSGGVDSAFLLAAAVRSGTHVLAATSTSASLASGEWAAAAAFAATLGVEHVQVSTQELERPGYAANGPDRCYHCKAELLDTLQAMATARGLAAVATGTNADDLQQPHRPGLLAASQRGVVTPLAAAGLTKVDIRAASREWRLPTWDKPQAACLASRLAYGVRVDADRLARVDRAEIGVRDALAAAGIVSENVRVRDLGDSASIEVDTAAVAEATATPEIATAALAAGFTQAVVDARGFRSGSLNESLLPGQRMGFQPGGSSWDLPVVD